MLQDAYPYIGDPSVSKVFNPKAFINVQDFSSIHDLAEYVKKVDMDDSLYMKYMQEAALRDVSFSKESQIALFKNFLSNILIPPI